MRKFFQFRLRTLVILTAILTPAVGLFMRQVSYYRAQYHALAELQPVIAASETEPAPAWIRAVIGDEVGKSVTQVQLTSLSDFDPFSVTEKKVEAKDLQRLGIFAELTRLDLNHVDLAYNDVSFLGNLKRLEHIELQHTNAGDAVAKQLGNLRRLKHVNAGGTNITQVGLASIAKNPALEELRIDGGTIMNCGPLSRCSHLKRLRISVWNSEDALNGLDQLPLTHLHVQFSVVKEFRVKGYKDLESMVLVSEDTRPVSVRRVGLSLIDMPKLSHLQIEGTTLKKIHLENLPALKVVKLSQSLLPEDQMFKFARLPNLETIDLSNSNIGDPTIEALVDAPKLKTLILIRTRITDDAIEMIAKMPTLETLVIENGRNKDAISALIDERPDLKVEVDVGFDYP